LTDIIPGQTQPSKVIEAYTVSLIINY